jgi:hypothetical protein
MSSKQPSRNARARPVRVEAAEGAREESADVELLHMIRRLLALPMEKRMHFLRVRLPNGGSCL